MADFKLSYRCNLACAACPFYHRAGKESGRMSWTSAVTSLDALKHLGVLKKSQERLRSGSSAKVWSSLHASRHGRLFVHFTINRENRQDIRPLLEELKNAQAFGGMTVQLFYPYGQGEAPLTLSDGGRGAVLEDVIEMKKQGFPTAHFTIPLIT